MQLKGSFYLKPQVVLPCQGCSFKADSPISITYQDFF